MEYVYSANNQPEPIDSLVSWILPEDRAKRIAQLLSCSWDKKLLET
jgi:hypothetical protein